MPRWGGKRILAAIVNASYLEPPITKGSMVIARQLIHDLLMENIISMPGFSEPFSSISHLLGAGFFLVVFVLMVIRHKYAPLKIFAICILGFSSIFLLSISGVYHLLDPQGDGRVVLQRLDHAAIFVQIASTFTAIHLVLFEGFWRWGIITLVWLIASIGIIFKTVFFVSLPEMAGLGTYIAFGWLGVATAIRLWSDYGLQILKPLIYGGIAYSIGAVFDFLQQPVLIAGVFGPHEIFHLAVLAGVGFHWQFVDRAFFHTHDPHTFKL